MSHRDTHPRPQLTRAHWTDLCGTWQFAYDDANVGIDEGWQRRDDVFDREIIVPFPPESRASGIGDTGFHPIVWYRRTASLTPDERSGRVILHFGAVDYRADVWVNGNHVASHEGGHTPFSVDITPSLESGEITIVVRAEDDPHDLTQPRGKQDWEREPHKIWYHRTTGIWQPVWLEPVPDLFIEHVRWTPDIDEASLTADIRLNSAPVQPVRLRIHLSLHGETLGEITIDAAGKASRGTIALDPGWLEMKRDQILWSPQHPNLVEATIDLLDETGVADTVQSYAGIRTVGIAKGRFTLNGFPTYLRMVLGQNYWPESHLAAPSADAIRREVELVRELGFNGVRIHQKVEDPRFLYWCDRLGIMVWGEMANAYTYSTNAVARFTREWMQVIERDASHPCIIAWVPINESWGVPHLERAATQRAYVQALYFLTKSLDPTRPVMGNEGWEHITSDILGIHDYSDEGGVLAERYGSPEALDRTVDTLRLHLHAIALDGARTPSQPAMLTEFGGISYRPAPGERWFGYGTVTSPDEFLATYEELVSAVLDSSVICGFCYTQLTDTLQETNGILDEKREPKLDIESIRRINQRRSRALPQEVVGDTQ